MKCRDHQVLPRLVCGDYFPGFLEPLSFRTSTANKSRPRHGNESFGPQQPIKAGLVTRTIFRRTSTAKKSRPRHRRFLGVLNPYRFGPQQPIKAGLVTETNRSDLNSQKKQASSQERFFVGPQQPKKAGLVTDEWNV
jgi:hypothetical protein